MFGGLAGNGFGYLSVAARSCKSNKTELDFQLPELCLKKQKTSNCKWPVLAEAHFPLIDSSIFF